MKYTNEQKRILTLCRKYKGVKVTFHNDQGCAEIFVKEDFGHSVKTFFKEEYNAIENWLSEYATLKSVGRPKGSTKPNRKVKKTITFTADKWSKVERIQREQGLKYASHAIGLAVEAFSKSPTAPF